MRVLALLVLAGCELIADVPEASLAPGETGDCKPACAAPTSICENEQCVECVTSADCADPARPVCDQNACRACNVDDECASAVCLGDGTCAASARILYASPSGTSTTCAQQDPCSLDTAATLVSAQLDIIKLLPGTYMRSMGLSFPMRVLLAGDGAVVRNEATMGFPTLFSGTGIELAMHGLSMQLGTNAIGVSCDGGGKLRIDRTRFDAGALAVVAQQCEAAIARTTIARTSYYGMLVSTGPLTMTNALFHDNGTGMSSSGGLFLQGVTSGTVEHSTFSRNNATSQGAKAVRCTNSGTVQFRSNIIFGNASPAIDNVCTVSYSVVDPGYAGPGTMNMQVDPQFVAPAAGDFQLGLTSPAVMTADPASAVAIDRDGNARPRPANTRADPGAYERD